MNQMSYNELKQKSQSDSASNLVDQLGFEASILVARDMLNDEEWDAALQEYAVQLLEGARGKFPDQWNSDWKYDAFLGYAYDIVSRYDERYVAYKRALEKANTPPPQLLVAIAGCCWMPGKPPISVNEAIELVQQAIKSVRYIEAVELLIGLYKSTGQAKEQKNWEDILEEIKDSGQHLPSLNSIS
jgi:hypothetical protein